MKKLIFGLIVVSAVFASVASVSTDQMSDMAVKIEQLEKRIRVLEDECGIEREKTPEEVTKQKADADRKAVLGKEIDMKVDAFLKEYLGVKLGDGTERFTKKNDSDYRGTMIPIVKKYGHFDQAVCWSVDNKLTGVYFYCDFDTKFSKDSVDKEVNDSLSQLCVSFGLPSNAYQRITYEGPKSRYFIHFRDDSDFLSYAQRRKFRRYGVDIQDMKYMQQLYEEKRLRENATGEKLPRSK